MRVDNGFPWGSSGDLPTGLALWLIGLGVDMIWNPPRRPQNNGVVERSQGVGKRWAEPHQCRSAEELQKRVDAMDRLQREQYPRQEGRSRLELFPELRHSGRPYHPAEEPQSWDWQRAAQHLTGYTAPRRVDSAGVVWLYNRQYYVGTKYHRQTVYASFDDQTCEWVFCDERGTPLRHRRASELERESILNLTVTDRRPRGKTRMSKKPAKPGAA